MNKQICVLIFHLSKTIGNYFEKVLAFLYYLKYIYVCASQICAHAFLSLS